MQTTGRDFAICSRPCGTGLCWRVALVNKCGRIWDATTATANLRTRIPPEVTKRICRNLLSTGGLTQNGSIRHGIFAKAFPGRRFAKQLCLRLYELGGRARSYPLNRSIPHRMEGRPAPRCMTLLTLDRELIDRLHSRMPGVMMFRGCPRRPRHVLSTRRSNYPRGISLLTNGKRATRILFITRNRLVERWIYLKGSKNEGARE
jgi:hypothetical protein